MLRPYLFFARIAVLISCSLPFGLLVYNFWRHYTNREESPQAADLWLKFGVLLAVCLPVCAAILLLPKRFQKTLDLVAQDQRKHLDSLPELWVDFGIVCSAALSLLLELSLIRWQGEVCEVFAFYKNFGLLACFLGLGLGYALAGRPQIPLLLSVPLLAWQMVLLLITRYGPEGWSSRLLRQMPVVEQLHMGLPKLTTGIQYAGFGFVLLVVLVVFVLSALAMVPIGQLCGSLLDRRPKLRAYGLNLIGSLAGVCLTFGLSVLWTPPIVWFGLCFLAALVFQAFNNRVLVFGLVASMVGLVGLAWPVTPMWEQIHSPYQLIERGPGEHGLTTIRAAGHYYQRIHDFASCERDPQRRWIAAYYAFPFRVHGNPDRVAVVGAGTGNDVAMALRMGAHQVDAIEIDPAIMTIGTRYHPDDPYHDSRVRPFLNDARSFLRTSSDGYDVIDYGLLDSHTLLSHASSVRLDSFVYTVEGFREARARLKDGGTLSLSFTILSPEQGRKIFLMLQEAFDGVPPVCVRCDYDSAVIFLERKGGTIELSPSLLNDAALKEATETFSDSNLHADASTDDWPFFYMPRRVYPVSYLIAVGLILVTSLILVVPFFRAQPHLGRLGFFFLGAGFMLVETKGITELGLTFGNTWQVIGIVIAGILAMAFLANCLVQWFGLRNLVLPYVLLLASLFVGLLLMKGGGFAPTPMGRVLAVVVLTCPLFFSGMAFSTLLQSSKDVSGAMAANLVGAMCGGMLEYNSMYFGFLFLYWLAIGIYGAAFLTSLRRFQHS